MKKLMLILSIISLMILTGCSSSQEGSVTERPGWIDHAEAKYPSSDYLTAVGEATNRTRSGKNATANLAEIFSVNIRAETKILTKAIKEQSILGVTSESSTSLERSIESETEQSLQGVEIKESWKGPRGQYFTLAVLHKRSATQNLTDIIMDSDKKSTELIHYSQHVAPNSILAINALRSARDAQLTRNMAELQLKYIAGRGILNDASNQKIDQLISNKLASLSVSVEVNDNKQKRILQSALSKLGVQVVDSSAPIQLSSVLDVNEPVILNNWYWLRGSYELNISENGQVISRKRWPIKVSAKQANLLEPRLQDKLSTNINKYLQELISDSPSL